MIRKVAVIMGSDSDWPVVKGACAQLKALGIPFEAHILSAHRTPAEAAEFAKNARANGFGVILCAAGMAAHLAGAFAANTTLPVIGIPMKGGAMDGLDALLATVQMPSGIPVATVALNGAKNAAWLAAEILALGDEALAAKLDAERVAMARQRRRNGVVLDGDSPHAEREVEIRVVLGQHVQVVSGRLDIYGRLLAQVWHQGQDVGAWLVAQGHAWSPHFRGMPGPYDPLQREAQWARRGVFSHPLGLMPPREFRRWHGSC